MSDGQGSHDQGLLAESGIGRRQEKVRPRREKILQKVKFIQADSNQAMQSTSSMHFSLRINHHDIIVLCCVFLLPFLFQSYLDMASCHISLQLVMKLPHYLTWFSSTSLLVLCQCLFSSAPLSKSALRSFLPRPLRLGQHDKLFCKRNIFYLVGRKVVQVA